MAIPSSFIDTLPDTFVKLAGYLIETWNDKEGSFPAYMVKGATLDEGTAQEYLKSPADIPTYPNKVTRTDIYLDSLGNLYVVRRNGNDILLLRVAKIMKL